VGIIGWGCTGPCTDVNIGGGGVDAAGYTPCREEDVESGCTISSDVSGPCTNSVCVDVEEGIGAPCCVLGDVDREEGEEAGRVHPCMKV
jgi:hypothetical protein